MDVNTNLVDAYIEMIKNLGNNTKLEIISKLSTSMQNEATESNEAFYKLFGSFDDDISAEEMIQTIRESRNFNRKIESFE